MKINEYIDYTLLKRDVLTSEMDKFLDEAIKYKFKAVCVNPTWVKYAKDYLKGKNILVVTVIGFPFGQFTTKTKVFEAKDSIKNGVDELDFIVNVSKIKEKDHDYLTNEFKKIRKATKGKVIKLIIETGLLNDEEKEFVSKIGVNCGFDFIKTSTGVLTTGANIHDIKLIKNAISGGALIKASGGVKTKKDVVDYINLGVSRIGTSNAVEIMENKPVKSSY